jgi:hypothetical protein
MGGCGMLVGEGCTTACPKLCSKIKGGGYVIIGCIGICLIACGAGSLYGCDKICDALCP